MSRIADDRHKLLEALKAGPVTTDMARAMGITQPGGRIHELRKKYGYPIVMMRMGGGDGVYVLNQPHQQHAA